MVASPQIRIFTSLFLPISYRTRVTILPVFSALESIPRYVVVGETLLAKNEISQATFLSVSPDIIINGLTIDMSFLVTTESAFMITLTMFLLLLVLSIFAVSLIHPDKPVR